MSRVLKLINTLLFVALVWQMLALSPTPAAAAPTAPFLSYPFYGTLPTVISLFDHNLPLPNTTNQRFVRHDGRTWSPPDRVDRDGCIQGENCYDNHAGYDIGLFYKPVVASYPGVISYSGWAVPNHETDFGLVVKVDHNNNHQTVYGHLSMVRYNPGTQVGWWQIGTSGTTGNSTGPHLHFQVHIWHNNRWKVTDPYGWSGAGIDPWTTQTNGVASQWLWINNDPRQNPPPNNGSFDVDDGGAGFSKGCQAGGTCQHWRSVTNVGFNNDLLWTYANGTATDYWARWRPSLPSTGYYEVLTYIPVWNSALLTHAARYRIVHATGSHTVIVDQHDIIRNTGHWISLGRYNFNQGSSGYVELTDAAYVGTPQSPVYIDPTTRRILVDGMRWIKAH